jgi:hypothetical protein
MSIVLYVTGIVRIKAGLEHDIRRTDDTARLVRSR